MSLFLLLFCCIFYIMHFQLKKSSIGLCQIFLWLGLSMDSLLHIIFCSLIWLFDLIFWCNIFYCFCYFRCSLLLLYVYYSRQWWCWGFFRIGGSLQCIVFIIIIFISPSCSVPTYHRIVIEHCDAFPFAGHFELAASVLGLFTYRAPWDLPMLHQFSSSRLCTCPWN